MGAIFSTFGIDWHLLLIQGVNFGILLAGLTYFLYRPVTRMLEERRRRVAKGMEDAAQAAQQLAAVEETRMHTLAEAGKEADTIVAAARVAGTEKQREIVAKAQTTAAAMVSEAEAQAADAKARAVGESKEEVAKLIVLGMERAFKEQRS